MTKITINYLDQTSGFTRKVTVSEGITATSFLVAEFSAFSSSKYNIRVNAKPVDADYVLNDGDTIICIPRDGKGA